LQSMAEPRALGGVQYFLSVTRRHGGDEIGIDYTAFHHVDRRIVEIIPEAILMIEVAVPIQSGGAQNVFSRHTLVLQIVEGVTDPRMRHPKMLINLVKQHWCQRRLPIVTMNNFRALAAFQHEFQGGPAKESESQVIVGLTVESSAIEKICRGMGLDEEAFAAMNETEINCAMNRLLVPRHPEVLIRNAQIVNLIVPQAVVFRQDDFDGVPADLQLAAQAKDHVPQSSNFGDWSALRG
jgi:hypothetical protein